MVIQQTSGTSPRTPDTKRKLLALLAWEYGPKAAGAFSVWTASFIPTIKTNISTDVQFLKQNDKYGRQFPNYYQGIWC